MVSRSSAPATFKLPVKEGQLSKIEHPSAWLRRTIEDQTEGETPMAQCIACGNETALHVNGQPLCPNCDEQRNGKTESAQSKVSFASRDQSEGFQPLLASFASDKAWSS